ncbi:hypothetical protein [Nocardia sp. NPDC051570]|uniref:hypothetical protein n=1 Tax=Nocardia sp. NPDC051570 TaxID=3364324 RepID=UPI0037B19302
MGFNWWRDEDAEPEEPNVSVQEIQDRLQRETSGQILGISWLHEPPRQPLNTDQAHRIMQQHRECRIDSCARKRAAWQTLIDSGRIKPDPHRNY